MNVRIVVAILGVAAVVYSMWDIFEMLKRLLDKAESIRLELEELNRAASALRDSRKP